jgi:hypothetical protein
VKDQYVLLTGGKNNAGDHLIKHRAKKLFQWLKPDARIIDLDGWKNLTDGNLNEINNSKALIMTGGPSLQNKMYPKVYALRDNLDDITVPMLTMGIGWYSQRGEWKDTHNYKLDNKSLELLEKINNSGYISSVRDYHTLNILHSLGMKNFLMTGCPALYAEDHLNENFPNSFNIKKIGYSLGVSMKTSDKMYRQMQDVLLMIKELFPHAKVDVVFHHSPTDEYLKTHGANKTLYNIQKKYLDWLEKNGFNYVDISGSADTLVSYYSNLDFHIGYRVHAHIFMNSISKPSVLLNEDGRGKALEKVLGGMIFNAYDSVNDSMLYKVLRKLSMNADNYNHSKFLINDLQNSIQYELENGIKFSQPRVEIDRHFHVMKQFIGQLPK